MKKHIANLILTTALFGAMLTACVEDSGLAGEAANDTPCIELTLKADNLTTRTKVGTSPFTQTEEEKINNVDLFFYAWDAGDASEPVKVHHIDESAIGEHIIKISETERSVIFGTDNKCKVYAVVNVSDEDYTASNVTKETVTIQQLRGIRANTPSFASDFDGFVMFTDENAGDEYNIATYDPDTRKATGTLKVKNLAAKIDLFVSFAETVSGVDPTEPGSTESLEWYAYRPAGTKDSKGTVEVYIVNGTTVVPLNGWTSGDYAVNPETNTSIVAQYLRSDDYYDLRTNDGNYSRHLVELEPETKNKEGFDYLIDNSIYTYPNQWTTDVLEQHQTYLLMKVNWMPDANRDKEEDENIENDLIETYYRIPINLKGDSENKLLSNRYYRVKVNINTLGGINFGQPLEVEASCEVLDWGSIQLDADVHEIRWLEITQKQKDVYDGETYQAIMNNTNAVTLSYNSTHSIFLKKIEIKYYNFQTSDPYDPELVSVIAYKKDGKKPSNYDSNLKTAGIDENVFLLDDEKLAWFNEKGEEPNGFYIDETNQTVTFYHSVYPLRGDNVSGGLPGKGKNYGVYLKEGDKTYSPFFVTFTLAHVDQPEFERTYTIKQYPGVYVEFTKNTGLNSANISIGRKVADGSASGSQSRYGIYVNGGATDTWTAGEWYEPAWRENNPSNSLQLGGIGGTLAAKNNNQNMYSIHVTQLSDDEILRDLKYYDGNQRYTRDVTFHVGDPRTKFFNNNLEGPGDLVDEVHDVNDRWKATSYSTTNAETRNAFRRKPATKSEGGAQRLYSAHPKSDDKTTLCYYYPTAEGQLDEQAFMIAPVFRFASGKAELLQANTSGHTSDNLIRENARRRCASFQENGYPAGRWRLPTIGELYFFRMLYTKGVLPEIFNTSRAYWCAQFVTKLDFTQDNANIRPYPRVSDVSEKHVRCVYDDWYWVKDDDGTPDIFTENDSRIDVTDDYAKYYGDSDKRTMFVWGDKEKKNPQQPN